MNGWKQFGKAFCYFLLFWGSQVAVAIIYTMFQSMQLTMEMMARGEGIDYIELSDRVMEATMEHAVILTLIPDLFVVGFLLLFFGLRKKKFIRMCRIIPSISNRAQINTSIRKMMKCLIFSREALRDLMLKISSILITIPGIRSM